MWENFGFKQNLYDHLPISANASGERLLVGRQEELDKLMLRIKGRNAIPTLEGDIGVGKTSIIAVSAFKLEKSFFEDGGNCFLAIERPFQLDPDETADRFSERVYQTILIKIHGQRQLLIDRGINVGDTNKLHRWLTAEQYNSGAVSLGPIGGGLGSEPNTSQGFTSLGFQNGVNLLLKGMFPNPKRGGVICVIDNLELLEKSAKAKATLESMRDKILTAHGLIWVVCGARGIVRGVASSPRLQGYLSQPIEIGSLSIQKLDTLIDRRVTEYAVDPETARVPVEQKGFLHIFRICKENLRTSFKFCSDFSEWLFESGKIGCDSDEKYSLLEVWLSEEADALIRDIKLTPKPWEVFDKIVSEGGSIAPSDHGKFGYDTPMAMRPQIKTLEDAGLVDSTVDDTDQRRRTISITPKGWLMNYSRKGYPT
jgi:hypothetical protein